MVVVQGIVKICEGRIIILVTFSLRVIRVAIEKYLFDANPKINGGEIIFEPVFNGIAESVTKI
jgi:hypothetical protein